MDPFVISKLSVAHVAMVLDDLSHMFRRKLLLSRVHKAGLATSISIPSALALLPFSRLLHQLLWCQSHWLTAG